MLWGTSGVPATISPAFLLSVACLFWVLATTKCACAYCITLKHLKKWQGREDEKRWDCSPPASSKSSWNKHSISINTCFLLCKCGYKINPSTPLLTINTSWNKILNQVANWHSILPQEKSYEPAQYVGIIVYIPISVGFFFFFPIPGI